MSRIEFSKSEEGLRSRAAARLNAYLEFEHALLHKRPRRAAAARQVLEKLGVLIEIMPEAGRGGRA